MKRKIGLMVAVCMTVLSCAMPQVFAATKNSGNIAEKLYRIGVLGEDYSERLQETANRCELARIAVELMGFDAEAISGGEGSSPVFEDVHPMSVAGSYVYAAGKLGLMNGYGSTFGVDDAVRYEDAVRVLLRAVGYGDYAENVVGLYRAVSETGIIRGVTAADGEAITYATLLEMADNALEIDLMYPVDTGESIGYMKENGKTLLGTVHHMTKISGTITANEYTDIYTGGSGKEGYISIDNVRYASGTSGAGEQIGCKVDAYIYDIDSDRAEVRYAEQKRGSAKVTVDIADYIDMDGNTLSYYADGRKEEADIAQTADVIYNNRWLCKYYDMDMTLPDTIVYGDITLYDSDGDDVFEVVLMRDIKTELSKAFDASARSLVCKDGVYDLSVSARDVVKVYKNGVPTAISALNAKGALEICESADKKMITVNIVTKTVRDTVREVGETTVTLGEKTYEYISKYSAADFAVGRGITVYVSGEKIIYVSDEATEDDMTYGVVSELRFDSGIGKKCAVKLFDEQGNFGIYEVADKVRLDGESTSDRSKIKTAVGSLEEARLIRFKRNSDGKITDIDTTVRGAEEDEHNLTENCKQQSLIYKNTKTFGNGAYYIGGDTLIFSVPDDILADERYALGTTSLFTNDVSYTVSAYDMDEYHIPKVLVVKNGGGSIEGDNSIIVVEKITKKRDADGTAINVIYGGFGGKTGQTGYWYEAGNSAIPNLETGDVIQVAAYATGEISACKILVNQKTTYGCTSSSAKYNYCYGTVETYDGVSGVCVIHTTEGGGERERISVLASARGYKVTEQRDALTVVTATAADLVPGKRIYVRERYLAPVEYVVFDE